MRQIVLDLAEVQLEIEWYVGQPFFHVQVNEWSPGYYKWYKHLFKDILSELKDEGVPKAFVLIPNNDKKLLKFEQMFGFDIVVDLGNAYIMSQEIK